MLSGPSIFCCSLAEGMEESYEDSDQSPLPGTKGTILASQWTGTVWRLAIEGAGTADPDHFEQDPEKIT